MLSGVFCFAENLSALLPHFRGIGGTAVGIQQGQSASCIFPGCCFLRGLEEICYIMYLFPKAANFSACLSSCWSPVFMPDVSGHVSASILRLEASSGLRKRIFAFEQSAHFAFLLLYRSLQEGEKRLFLSALPRAAP